MGRKHCFGFTLAELLIALAILGVIATFTIPKILASQQSSKRVSVFKETISALSNMVYTGQTQGGLSGANFNTYILANVNGIKVCSTDADAEGCWTQATPGGSAHQAGFTLSNGASVAGLDTGSGSGSGYGESFFIDWNGTGPPNVEGADQIRVRACWGNGNCSASQRPGTVLGEPGQATSITLFEQIFN